MVPVLKFSLKIVGERMTTLEDEVKVELAPAQIMAGVAVAVTIGAGTTTTTTLYVSGLVHPLAVNV
jgi:hypothetical protein